MLEILSFEVGIMTVEGKVIGVCVKFFLSNHSEVVLHFPTPAFSKLKDGLLYYGEHGRHTNFMMRAHANPSLIIGLPQTHPYFTLLNNIPKLTSEEISDNTLGSTITFVNFSDGGSGLEVEFVPHSGAAASFKMHEYIAHSLYGYLFELDKNIELYKTPVAGPSH